MKIRYKTGLLTALMLAMMATACEEKTVEPEVLTCPYPVEGVESSTIMAEDAKVEFSIVKVEPGSFLMGADGDDTLLARSNECPAHHVRLSKEFYIGTTEVTQMQFHALMGTLMDLNMDSADFPMTNVTIEQIDLFCQRLSQQCRRVITLPTEAQWEYAARGGHVAPGEKTLYAGGNDIDLVAWYYGNTIDDFGKRSIKPVAQKWPNPLGLYDMTGNAWEWVKDAYDIYDVNDTIDPVGGVDPSFRVIRGGGWSNNANRCRLTIRAPEEETNAHGQLGFRIVMLP